VVDMYESEEGAASAVLVMHCGGRQATLEEVRAVPVPKAKGRWSPIPYGDTIDLVVERARVHLKAEPSYMSLGLNKNGNQMFGVIAFRGIDDPDFGIAMGLRNSYNKSLAQALAAGLNVFACDNLAFSGSDVRVLRKNTTRAWPDFKEMVDTVLLTAPTAADNLKTQMREMMEVEVARERGWEILGRALGEGVLRPTAVNAAVRQWNDPPEHFADRTAYNLYQAMTEGAKCGAPGQSLDRHTAIHSFAARHLLTA
jgi:hypothetical protein